MARKTGALLKVAAMLGLAVAAKQLSKKENRDAVVNEYNKVKEDPKGYAQNVQEKVSKQAGEYQEKARDEYSKVKDDPKGYAQNVQSKVTEQAQEYQDMAKSEVEKAKEDPKGYAQNAQEKAKSKLNKEDADQDSGRMSDSGAADDENEENNQNDKISPTQTRSSETGDDTKPDRMDAEGQLTTEQMNNEWISEGSGVHPQEELQDAVSHGSLNKDNKVDVDVGDVDDIDVVDDQGDKDDNHNIHVVTDEDSDKNNKK